MEQESLQGCVAGAIAATGVDGATGAARRRCVASWIGRVGYREAVEMQETAATALKRAQLGNDQRGVVVDNGT